MSEEIKDCNETSDNLKYRKLQENTNLLQTILELLKSTEKAIIADEEDSNIGTPVEFSTIRGEFRESLVEDLTDTYIKIKTALV